MWIAFRRFEFNDEFASKELETIVARDVRSEWLRPTICRAGSECVQVTITKGLPESCKDVEEWKWEVGNAAGLYTADLPLRHTVCEVAPQPNRECGLAWLSILSGAVSASDEAFLFAGSSVNSAVDPVA